MSRALTLLLAATAASLHGGTARADDPPAPIRIGLSDEVVAPGERVRIKVKVGADGYLLVLRADALGRVRVLFPVDPTDTASVRAGREYDIRGRGDREGFLVDEREGSGVVLAAVSKTPFTFQEFTRGVHWDYRALAARDSSADPEAALLEIVDRMTGGDYDYDVASYTVSARAYDRRHAGWGWGGGWGGWGWPYPCIGCRPWYGRPRIWIGGTVVIGRPRFIGRRSHR